jgi:hypothetical protein
MSSKTEVIMEWAVQATDALLAPSLAGPDPRFHALGILRNFQGEDGVPMVEIPGLGAGPVMARSVHPLSSGDAGRQVVLVAEGGDWGKPIIMGIIREASQTGDDGKATALDGRRIKLEAEREILLRCGSSSILMTREGKIVIKGINLVSRAAAVNKIKGGAVHLN